MGSVQFSIAFVTIGPMRHKTCIEICLFGTANWLKAVVIINWFVDTTFNGKYVLALGQLKAAWKKEKKRIFAKSFTFQPFFVYLDIFWRNLEIKEIKLRKKVRFIDVGSPFIYDKYMFITNKWLVALILFVLFAHNSS